MNDRDRFARNREQGGFGQLQQRRPWDRQQSESGGYPDEDRDRGYSRLGGAGEEEYERYQRGGNQQDGYQQRPRDYDREYSGRDYYGRDYSDERGYYGPERGYGHDRMGQYGERTGQRDWGRQRGATGTSNQLDYGMRELGDRTGYSHVGPRDSGGYDNGQRGDYSQNSFGNQRSAGGPQRQFGQRSERGRFAGLGPKGYKRSDERIREDVCDAFMMDPEIDASEIEIKVSDGEVTMSGTVQDREDKWRAEQLAESIPGVRDVNNTIRSKRGGSEQSSSANNDAWQRNARSGGQSSGNVNQSGAGNNTRS
jgi:osmotically-inducible protein OsmY